MGGMSLWHWILVLVVIVLLFGKKLPNLGGDLAKSIKGFKDGMKGEEDKAAQPTPTTAPTQTIDVEAKDKSKL
jgi:sec-independent protein translocase protein TatA